MAMTDLSIYDELIYFGVNEKWGDPLKMNEELLYELDMFRGYVGAPVVIHCGYEDRPNRTSTHTRGLAVDCHVKGMSLLDQYMAASRFNFGGIGVYDDKVWNNPGLHLDMRPDDYRAIWGCTVKDAGRKYVSLDKDFIKSILDI